MPTPLPRITSDIDAELRVCCSARRAAQAELAAVRRRQAELAELEGQLLLATKVPPSRRPTPRPTLHAAAAGIDGLQDTAVAERRRLVRTDAATSTTDPLEVLERTWATWPNG